MRQTVCEFIERASTTGREGGQALAQRLRRISTDVVAEPAGPAPVDDIAPPASDDDDDRAQATDTGQSSCCSWERRSCRLLQDALDRSHGRHPQGCFGEIPICLST